MKTVTLDAAAASLSITTADVTCQPRLRSQQQRVAAASAVSAFLFQSLLSVLLSQTSAFTVEGESESARQPQKSVAGLQYRRLLARVPRMRTVVAA